MKCDHCDARLSEANAFRHKEFLFCTECVSQLVSWFLDGGTVTDPEMFDYVLTPSERAELQNA